MIGREYCEMEFGDTLKKLQTVIRKIWKRNPGGCCLHVTVNDGNWDYVPEGDELEHKDCRKAADLINKIDLEARWLIDIDYHNETMVFGDDPDEVCEHCGR